MRGNFNIFTSKSNIAMKQFFKFMFASMLGVFLSFFLLLVLFLMMVGALMSASTGEKTVTVAENSLLITRFDHPIPERTPQTPFSLIGLSRSEEHTSELQSLMRISYAVFCLKK